MDLSVENVCGLLIRSRLLSVDEVKAMYQRWLTEAGEGTDLGRFAQWLVRNRYVTEYQALLLTRGHAENFFLGDYKILERLGQGCMAGVYKAVHKLGQVVAIKVLPPSRARNAHALARFQREAALALRLNHPNVVRAFQTGTANGLSYIVMEYLEGETLDERLKRQGRLPPAEAVRLIHQALLGLQHLQEQGIVHRDLKPSNLMLVGGESSEGPSTTVKILDVGLGKALFDENAPAVLGDPNLTGEGVLLGTPDYLAPEQARNAQKADVRADIYSLGCVLYHLIAGRLPFPDTNVVSQMIRHSSETPQPLREFNPDVPDGLQQIVDWMMAKDPARRYPTPARAAQALEVFLVAGQQAPEPPPDDPTFSTYLNWLQKQGNGAPAAAAVPTEAMPIVVVQPTPNVATPPPAELPAVSEAAPGPAAETSSDEPPSEPRPQETKRRGRSNGETMRPRTRPAPKTFDVELVGLPPPQPVADRRGFRLDRRDLIVFILGAVSVLVSGLFGFLIQRLVRWLRTRR